jgi:hypothetical protein
MDTDIDLTLYEAPIADLEKALAAEHPILSAEFIREAELAVKTLVLNDWLYARRCEYANGPKTVICENYAPLGRLYCLDHEH